MHEFLRNIAEKKQQAHNFGLSNRKKPKCNYLIISFYKQINTLIPICRTGGRNIQYIFFFCFISCQWLLFQTSIHIVRKTKDFFLSECILNRPRHILHFTILSTCARQNRKPILYI